MTTDDFSFATDVSSRSRLTHSTQDFTGYLDVVDASIFERGGEGCGDRLAKAVAQFAEALADASRRGALTKLFNTCTPLTASSSELDLQNFASNAIGTLMRVSFAHTHAFARRLTSTLVTGGWMGVTQYNMDLARLPTIRDYCSVLLENNASASPLDSLAAVATHANFTGGACTGVSYADMMAELNNVTDWGITGTGMRQWTYQTCTAFGYYQTTDRPSIFKPAGTNLIPLSFYERQCRDAFNIEISGWRESWVNGFYGGKRVGDTTRIAFVNGDIDPWHVLSVLTNSTSTPVDDGVVAYVMPDAGHCAAMEPSPLLADVAATQALLSDLIGHWLETA